MDSKVAQGDPSESLVFFAEALKAKSTGKHTSPRAMTDTGSWSELDPKTATAESGREEVDAFVAVAVKFIEAWKKLRSREAR